MNCTPTPEFVDIQYHGYVFRLAIHQLREATLLERTGNTPLPQHSPTLSLSQYTHTYLNLQHRANLQRHRNSIPQSLRSL